MGGVGFGSTSCRQPAALSGAHLAQSPLPARKNLTDAERILEKSKAVTMVGVEEGRGGVPGWWQVGVWREGGSCK